MGDGLFALTLNFFLEIKSVIFYQNLAKVKDEKVFKCGKGLNTFEISYLLKKNKKLGKNIIDVEKKLRERCGWNSFYEIYALPDEEKVKIKGVANVKIENIKIFSKTV